MQVGGKEEGAEGEAEEVTGKGRRYDAWRPLTYSTDHQHCCTL
jgi:hypothetical protein